MYSKYGAFRALRGEIDKWGKGDQTLTDLAEIWHVGFFRHES